MNNAALKHTGIEETWLFQQINTKDTISGIFVLQNGVIFSAELHLGKTVRITGRFFGLFF
ncbi:hypothetical protein [Alteribacillus bidgolensis]|uniref:Uncharacterized protein n=1 Tax=Alteribacillus bidgolensis TaxID=930129 RepID=A0A1G8NQ09_9BACI|nr:hypothetical protein [Alteribacillus bidgolensis]SDI82278.1 hypothetical protein SAMN05216352_112112 [Alteribacillus bidgolensis]